MIESDWWALAERLEVILDRLDALDPAWRLSLPSCRHTFCYWSIPVAYLLEQANSWLRLLGEPEGVWSFAQDADMDDFV